MSGDNIRLYPEAEGPYFYAVITHEGQELSAGSIRCAAGGALYTISRTGAKWQLCIIGIREEVEELLEDMVQQCIDGTISYAHSDYVAERYQSYPQFPEECSEHGTLKTAAKGKWYGVIMVLSKSGY